MFSITWLNPSTRLSFTMLRREITQLVAPHSRLIARLNSVGYNFLTGYNAVTGYDAASGLGSVDATQMLNNWASAGLSATTSSLKLNGATTAINITHGQSVAVSASVTSGGGTPAGDVALVDNLSAAALPNNESIG